MLAADLEPLPVVAAQDAVAVAVEGGGYGASTAAPIARKILDAWLVGTPPAIPTTTAAATTGDATAVRPDFGNVAGSPGTSMPTPAESAR